MKTQKTAIFVLIVASIVGIFTTAYQWLALYALRKSGDKPICAVNEQLDCAAVWESAISTMIHQYSGIPIAGWGLIWSLLILLLSLKLLLNLKTAKDSSLVLNAMHISSLAAIVIVAGLALYSFSISVFCISCIVFYLVVAIIAATVLTMLKVEHRSFISGAGVSLAITIVLALLLYFPGQATPLESVFSLQKTASTQNQGQANNSDIVNTSSENLSVLNDFISSQPEEVKQIMSNFLEEYRYAKRITLESDLTRLSVGSENSPVKLVEWLEITCPHCAQLDQQLSNIKNSTNDNDWSLETRYYPLDSECNPDMNRSRNNGVSCLAAKSLICLADDRETSHKIRSTFFANQKQLSTDLIKDIIRDHQVDMIQLQACLESDETEQDLLNDIAMARQHNISGTPLLVMNGKALTAMPHLIYSLILSKGDTESTAFKSLPSPQEISHEGHNH